MGITIAGQLHTFKFSGTMERIGFAANPAWYRINPTTSEDAWWIAESGKIKVSCTGAYSPTLFGRRLWIGTVSGVAHEVHTVMAPGHPSF